MNLKTIKPMTPSQRHLIKINNTHLKKNPLLKSKIKGLKNSSGRNNTGKITSYHRGGGHKQNYRKLESIKGDDVIGIVTSIEYDPNRTANIASIYETVTKTYFYMLAPEHLTIGDIIKSGTNAENFIGHSLPIYQIPEGSYIHNISIKKNGPRKISRSAGTYANLIERNAEDCTIMLPSGKLCKLSSHCFATLGIVSNESHISRAINKAGRSRWLNKRPTVRGVAMNPVDHPNGGGEGKKSGKNVTPWGKPNYRRNKIKIKKDFYEQL